MNRPLALCLACLAFSATCAAANDLQPPPAEDKPPITRATDDEAELIAHLELLEMLELLESLDTFEAQPEATP